MPDVLMITGWFAHMLLLAGGAALVAHRLKFPRRDWPFIVFILVWVDLVLAGHIASLAQSLNNLGFYIGASVVSLGALALVLRYVHTASAPLMEYPRLEFASINNPGARKFTLWALGITSGLVLFFALVVVTSSYPDNADSIIYRLPRAFWYVSNGSFLHPFDALDKRLIFYPLDGVALYVPMVLYALPGVFHNFPSLIMWLAVAYSSYRFARELGAEKLIAFFAAWLVSMTPNIMAQSVSTNDEILASAALLVGLFMGWRWLVTGTRSYFLLAALSVGLSVGTKLHIVFLSPLILVALGIAVVRVVRSPQLIKKWAEAIGSRAGVVSVIAALVMIVPFLFYNYASSNRFYFLGDFAHDVFNLKSSLQGALQNLLIYTSQMVFAPIADLNVWPISSDRQSFNNMLNKITAPLIVPFISKDPSFYHASYRFVGVTIPVSVRFLEFSLWAGFVWTLWPLQIALIAKNLKSFALKPLFLLLAMTPLLWLVLWSFSTLYMEGTATYFSFYLTVAAPAAVLLFLPIRRNIFNELRWVMIVIVALTSFVIVGNIFAYSGFRSVPDIVRTANWPFDWLLFDREIVKEIRKADRIRVVYTHEKMPYFAFMRWNPRAIYTDPYKPLPEKDTNRTLQIIPASSFNFSGFMPVKIPGKLTPGATFLGLMRGIGREAIFAVGNDVEKRHVNESDYIIPQIKVYTNKGGFVVSLVPENVAGYNYDDNLEFRYEIRAGENFLQVRDWSRNIGMLEAIKNDPTEYQHHLTIKVRSAWSHKELATRSYQILGPGAWLPDGPEY
ncbi:MAG: hypothetical protein PHX43_04985 [Alphaproteobacteria bacterium]|nr:hypothetical protein [Alphaproteobacteria bacterium]